MSSRPIIPPLAKSAVSKQAAIRTDLDEGAYDHHLVFSPVNRDMFYEPPKRYYKGDAGFDLVVARQATISPQQFALISTNIRVALPRGCWGMLIGRSSSFFKRQLVTYPGIIDNGWRGELFAMVYNLGKDKVVVKPGERIVQLIIYNLVVPDMIEVPMNAFPSGERGERGFGSTTGRQK